MAQDEDNGHKKTDSIADMVEQAMEGTHTNGEGKRFANRTFSALDDKQLGVLPTIMRAIKSTSEYRQELKTANWTDRYEAMKAVAAIHERVMCGVPIDPIIDRIIAESAGVNSGRLELVIRGLTHTVNYTNPASMNKQHWWNNKKGNKEPSSSSHDLLQ